MRWLFIILLLLNLGLFGWFYSNREDTPVRPGQPASGSLMLLGESSPTADGDCYQSEPMASENDAALVADRYGDQARVVAEEQSRPVGYWVFLPPRSSFDAARRDLARLQDAGVTDFGLVSESGMGNAISLGIYNSEERAEQRRLDLEDRGFDALMEQRFRARTYYRVQLEMSSAPDDNRVEWEKTDCQMGDD